MQSKLDQVDEGIRRAVPRKLLKTLARRFDDCQPDAPIEQLAEFLEVKAEERKELKGGW